MKTLIAIISCDKHAERVDAQEATWIPRMRAAGYDVEIFNGGQLGVPDDYVSLPFKTKRVCAWALEHGYQRLLKLDDDAYIRIEKFSAAEHEYAGIRMPAHDGWPRDYASGGAYWLGEPAMRIVSTNNPADVMEDRWVGQLMGAFGFQLKELPGYVIWSRDAREFSVRKSPVDENSVVITQLYPTGSNDAAAIMECHRRWGR